MKKILPVLFSVALVCSAFLLPDKHENYSWSGNEYRVECQFLNGMYDGTYHSRYLNGKMKAAGTFKNNQRVGKWTVWDSTGRMRMQREYKNNFEYTRTFPAYPEGPAKLFSAPVYELKYNEKDFLPYFSLHERAMAVSKRNWRFIPADETSPLFENERLYQLLLDSVVQGRVKMYADDEGRKAIRPDDIKSDSGASGSRLVGYSIKEDWFFDTDRMLSETRLLFISPVIVNQRGDTSNLGWIYYPFVRSMLAREKISRPDFPSYIHSLDDLFFFRCFHGFIFSESSVYNRGTNGYSDGTMLKEEQDRAEFSLIELEHEQWIRFSP